VNGQLHTLSTSPPWKDFQIPISLEGWVDSRAGMDTMAKDSLPLPEIEPQLSSLCVSCYSDWALLAPNCYCTS